MASTEDAVKPKEEDSTHVARLPQQPRIRPSFPVVMPTHTHVFTRLPTQPPAVFAPSARPTRNLSLQSDDSVLSPEREILIEERLALAPIPTSTIPPPIITHEDSGNADDASEPADQLIKVESPRQHIRPQQHEGGARAQLKKAPRLKKYRTLPRGVSNRMLAALMRELGVCSVDELETKMTTSDCILVPRGRNLCHINPNSKRAVYILLFQGLIFGYNYLCDDEFVERGRKFIVPGCRLGAQRGSGRFPKDSIRMCINPCHYEIDYDAALMIGFSIDRNIDPRKFAFKAEQPYVMQREGSLTTIARTDILGPRPVPSAAIQAGMNRQASKGMPGWTNGDQSDNDVIYDEQDNVNFNDFDDDEDEDEDDGVELNHKAVKRRPADNNRLRNALFLSVASHLQEESSVERATSSPDLKDKDAAQALLSLFSTNK